MSRFIGAEENMTFKLSWDIEIDTNDLAATIEIPTPTRFGGLWTLFVGVRSPQHLDFTLNISGADKGAVGIDVTPGWEFSWLNVCDVAIPLALDSDDFCNVFPRQQEENCSAMIPEAEMLAAEKRSLDFLPSIHRRFRAEFILKNMEAPPSLSHSLPPSHLATYIQPSLHSSRPDRVRLFLPRVNAELWDNASFLSTSSPYFKTLLDSNSFVENERRGRIRKRARMGPAPGDHEAATPAESVSSEQDSETKVDDSDEETDDILHDLGLLKVEEPADDDEDFTYRQITITHASYCTYLAVLLWLHSSFIDFEDLLSSLPLDWQDSFRGSLVKSTQQLLCVSRKSVYRLAHLLELPHLQALALSAFKTCLTVDIAATELFSDTSLLFDEIRAVALDFVVENWAGDEGVKQSAGMEDVRRRIDAGELPRSGSVMAALLMRLA